MAVMDGELSFIVVVGLVLLLSVVCNVLVMVVVALTPPLRTPTNVLISNLAASDLILASIVLPQNLHDVSHADDNYYEGDFLCRMVFALPLLCIMASIYSMVAISFDRTAAILLNTQQKLTTRSALLQLTLIWILSFTFCVPTLYEHREFEVTAPGNSTVKRCGSHGVSWLFSVLNGVGLLLMAYLAPLIVLLVNYGKILAFFRSKGLLGRGATEQGAVFQMLFKTRMMVVKMLILVALLFALSWAPYFVLLLIEKISGISDNSYMNAWGNMLRIALSAFSTAYNFALYVVYNRNFRLGLQKLLRMGQRPGCPCARGQVAPDQIRDEDFCVSQYPGTTQPSTPPSLSISSSTQSLKMGHQVDSLNTNGYE